MNRFNAAAVVTILFGGLKHFLSRLRPRAGPDTVSISKMVTTHLHRVRIQSVLKWVSLGFPESNVRSSRTSFWPTGYHIVHCLRSYGRKKLSPPEEGPEFGGCEMENAAQLSPAAWKEAQAALQEYLHSTRSLQFVEAEYISRNSPCFLEKLLKKVKNEAEIGRSVTRFLRYHPINEFEPFFESIGLKPAEYALLLPRELMYLTDDAMLLENYQVLCSYGIGRNNIGRIYKEATEAFKLDNGVLYSKLRALEEIGLSQSTVIKFVSSSPSLLIGDRSRELRKVLDRFKSFGIEHGWIQEHLLEGNSYEFTHMLQLLCLLGNMGCSAEKLQKIFFQHPGLLFEDSGKTAISLIGFLLKFGSTKKEIYSVLKKFPRVKVGNFVSNLRKCYNFLVEIEIEVQDIGRIVHSHPLLLGSCCLKKLDILLADLNTEKEQLCDAVMEDPRVLKGWVIGSRVKQVSNLGVKQVSNLGAEELRSRMMKMKFLMDLGFVENSNEMTKALKVFRGKREELQERFDCFVKAGLDRKDVSEMIKVAPQVLNQSEEVIKRKMDFLVNGLGYPVSSLVAFPAFVSYTIQRVKLRLSMYDWLKEQKIVRPNLSFSTVVGCSDELFIKQYVNKHPRGPKIWEKLKKKIYTD